jgi:hypothetical protein
MFDHSQTELARLIQQDREDQARRTLQGFCCAQDRRDLERAARLGSRPSNPTTCDC